MKPYSPKLARSRPRVTMASSQRCSWLRMLLLSASLDPLVRGPATYGARGLSFLAAGAAIAPAVLADHDAVATAAQAVSLAHGATSIGASFPLHVAKCSRVCQPHGHKFFCCLLVVPTSSALSLFTQYAIPSYPPWAVLHFTAAVCFVSVCAPWLRSLDLCSCGSASLHYMYRSRHKPVRTCT